MRALSPWAPLSTFKQEMDRLVDRFLEPRWEMVGGDGDWTPTLDVSETTDAVIVKAEVPGVEQKDLEVSLLENVLTIKGEKRQEKEEKDERHHRMERSYGAFIRSVTLPSAVEGAKVTADFKNGLVTVTLPKAPAARGTTIPVKGS